MMEASSQPPPNIIVEIWRCPAIRISQDHTTAAWVAKWPSQMELDNIFTIHTQEAGAVSRQGGWTDS